MVGMSDAVDRARIAKIQGWSDSVRTSLMGSRVSEWKFDEAAGTLALDTVGANTGTLLPASTGPAWTTSSCVSGACLSFDGVDDHLYIPNSAALTPQILTVELWEYNFDLAVNKCFLNKRHSSSAFAWRSYTLTFENSDYRFYINNGTGALNLYSNFTGNVGWHHVAGVYDGQFMKIYVDGEIKNSANVGNVAISYDTNLLYLGTFDGANSPGALKLDEVRIYNAALPASAVREQYLAGLDQLLAANQITQQEYRQRLADLDSACAARE